MGYKMIVVANSNTSHPMGGSPVDRQIMDNNKSMLSPVGTCLHGFNPRWID